jgi:hypothetical protein
MGVLVHAYNPSIQRLTQEDPKFKASLGYIDFVSKEKEKVDHQSTFSVLVRFKTLR